MQDTMMLLNVELTAFAINALLLAGMGVAMLSARRAEKLANVLVGRSASY